MPSTNTIPISSYPQCIALENFVVSSLTISLPSDVCFSSPLSSHKCTLISNAPLIPSPIAFQPSAGPLPLLKSSNLNHLSFMLEIPLATLNYYLVVLLYTLSQI